MNIYKNYCVMVLLTLGIVGQSFTMATNQKLSKYLQSVYKGDGLKENQSNSLSTKIKSFDLPKNEKIKTQNDVLSIKKSGDGLLARSWAALKKFFQKKSVQDDNKPPVTPFRSKTFQERAKRDLDVWKQDLASMNVSSSNPLDKEYLNRLIGNVKKHKDLTDNERSYIKDKLKLFLPSKYKDNQSPGLVRKDFYSIITVPSKISNHDVLQKFNKELDLLKTLYIQFFRNQTFSDIEHGFKKLEKLKDISKEIAENKDLLEEINKELLNYQNKILNRNQINIKAQLISDLKNKEKNEEELLKQSNKLLQLNEIKNAIELINIESKKRNNNIEKIINSFILETYFFKNILKCLEEEKNDIKEREKEIDNQKKKNEKTDQLKIDVHCLKIFLQKCEKFEVNKDYRALLEAIKNDYFGKINEIAHEDISADTFITSIDAMIKFIKETSVEKSNIYQKIQEVISNSEKEQKQLKIKLDSGVFEGIYKTIAKIVDRYINNKISLNDLKSSIEDSIELSIDEFFNASLPNIITNYTQAYLIIPLTNEKSEQVAKEALNTFREKVLEAIK